MFKISPKIKFLLSKSDEIDDDANEFIIRSGLKLDDESESSMIEQKSCIGVELVELSESIKIYNQRILKAVLDLGQCFDFEYTPKEGDVLELNLHSVKDVGDLLLYQFVFKKGSWQAEEAYLSDVVVLDGFIKHSGKILRAFHEEDEI